MTEKRQIENAPPAWGNPSGNRTPAMGPEIEPVFVLSAGWRSGSTALQRLIVSGGEAFLWGEPFPTARLLPRLERMVAEAGVLDSSAHRILEGDQISSRLWDSWIAVTNPPAGAVLDGARAMLQTVYWQPLVGSSFRTWGTKEVTASPRQMAFLRSLYPQAKFVCVVRDPLAAYRSFRRFVISGVTAGDGSAAKLVWLRGPVGFARHWNECARYFRESAAAEGVMVQRLEDIQGKPSFVEELGTWLGMDLKPEAWAASVGNIEKGALGRLEAAELAVVRRLTAHEASRWGYAE